MKDILVYSCILLVGLLLVKSGRTVENTLKCYQCQLVSLDLHNAVCQPEDLKQCPNDYASDRCITTIKKNVTGHYLITKKCALAPCEFKETGTNNLFKLSECDLDKVDVACSKCCEIDGCNYANSAVSLTQRVGDRSLMLRWLFPSLMITTIFAFGSEFSFLLSNERLTSLNY